MIANSAFTQTAPQRYGIYARISVRGDRSISETSIPLQISRCRSYVDAAGGEVTKIYQDDESGATLDRAGMKAILQDIELKERPWSTLVVYRLDRLSRNLRDFLDLFDTFRKRDVAVASLHERVDFSSPIARAGMAIFAVVAQLYREQASVAVSEKMSHMVCKEGKFLSRPPYGYAKSKDRARKNELEVVPDQAVIVKEIFRRYSEGASVDQLHRLFPHLKVNRICAILRNQHFVGKIQWAGKVYPGVHEPIVDQATFDLVQARLPMVMSGPRPNACKYDYLLTGLFRCLCGKAMCPYHAYGRPKPYSYYACKDTWKCKIRVPAERTERVVISAIKAASDNQVLITKMVGRVKQQQATELEKFRAEMVQIESAIATTRRAIASLQKAFAEGMVSKENSDFMNAELAQKRRTVESLEATKAEIQPRIAEWQFEVSAEAVTAALVALTQNLVAAEKNPDELRFLLAKAVRRIKIVNARKWIRIELDPVGNPKVTLMVEAMIPNRESAVVGDAVAREVEAGVAVVAN